MSPVRFIGAYVFWHYTRALFNIVTIWKNFLWFVYHFFSLPTLVSTLFAPWKRLGEKYSGGFDLEELGTVIIVNTLMRLVGAIARIAVISVGIIFFTIVFVVGIVFGVIWLLMPVVLAILLTIGATRFI